MVAATDDENAGYDETEDEQHDPDQNGYYQSATAMGPVFPSYMSLTGPRDRVCNPCCCCSLRWGTIVVGTLIFLAGIYSIVDAILGPFMFGSDATTHTALTNQLKRKGEFMWSHLFGPLLFITLPGLLLIVAAAKLVAAIWLGVGSALFLIGAVVFAEMVGKLQADLNATDQQKMNFEKEKGLFIVFIWIAACFFVSFGLYASICAVELYRQIRNGEYKVQRSNAVMAAY